VRSPPNGVQATGKKYRYRAVKMMSLNGETKGGLNASLFLWLQHRQ